MSDIREQIIRNAEKNLRRKEKNREQSRSPENTTHNHYYAESNPPTRFHIYLILGNAVAWIAGLPLLFLSMGETVEDATRVFVVELVFIPLGLLITYIAWRLYWWITGCLWTIYTALLILALLASLFGLIDPNTIRR